MSASSRRLVLALRVLALALVALHLAAPRFTEAAAWGLWPATYLPLPWRSALAAAAAALILFGDRLPVSALPAIHVPAPAARLLLAAASALPFYLFRIVHTRWGDAFILVHSIAHPQVHLTYSWQAPFDVFLHAQVWAVGARLFGWVDAAPAYWLLSALAGVAFVWVLLGFAAWFGRSRAERALLCGLVLTLGTMQLFFGYIENYTYMTLGVLVYAWLALRALRGETPLFAPAAALALTHAFHPSTLVLAPTLLYVAWQAPGRAWRRTLSALAVPYLLVGLAVFGLMTAGGHGLDFLLGSDAPGGADHAWFVPLSQATTRWEHYTMFSAGHLRDMINEQLLAAPVVLPALLLVAAGGRRLLGPPGEHGPTERADVRTFYFLFFLTACYLLLIWTWNPDYGGQRDWDLFAPAALPAALLLAYCLPRALPEGRALRAAGWALVAAGAFHTVAWIYQNTLPWSWS